MCIMWAWFMILIGSSDPVKPIETALETVETLNPKAQNKNRKNPAETLCRNPNNPFEPQTLQTLKHTLQETLWAEAGAR